MSSKEKRKKRPGFNPLSFFGKRPNRSGPSCAFTIVEMTLVVSLMAMVGLAVYQSITNGLKVWQRAGKMSYEEDLAVFFDKLSTDIHNTFVFAKLPFQGKESVLSFPTIIRTAADSKGTSKAEVYVEQLGAVQYRFDPLTKTLVYAQANYSQSLKEKFGRPRVLLTSVYSLAFSYLTRKEGKTVKELRWEEGVPEAVIVELKVLDERGEVRTMEKIINVPIVSRL